MQEKKVTKTTFDEMSDFKLIAAYEVYSKLFDEISSSEDREVLNEAITQLYDKEISYENFYEMINQFREDSQAGSRFRRARISGQRKRAYRRNQQEIERIKRHKR